LTDYFENTKKDEGVLLNLETFMKIAFKSGMPLIVIDFMIYLSGGCNTPLIV